jgi:hypothetical protein
MQKDQQKKKILSVLRNVQHAMMTISLSQQHGLIYLQRKYDRQGNCGDEVGERQSISYTAETKFPERPQARDARTWITVIKERTANQLSRPEPAEPERCRPQRRR